MTHLDKAIALGKETEQRLRYGFTMGDYVQHAVPSPSPYGQMEVVSMPTSQRASVGVKYVYGHIRKTVYYLSSELTRIDHPYPIQPGMTYKELLAKLKAMTPKQLSKTAIYQSDNDGEFYSILGIAWSGYDDKDQFCLELEQ